MSQNNAAMRLMTVGDILLAVDRQTLWGQPSRMLQS